MKKIVILFIAIVFVANSFAQRVGTVTAVPVNFVKGNYRDFSNDLPYGKTTAMGDTVIPTNILTGAPLTVYKLAEGGYVTGTNYWGDKAFAERFDYNNNAGRDMQVIGLLAQFSGDVVPTSTKTITFKVWGEGPQQMISASKHYRGFPNAVLDSLVVPVTQLGIGATVDTLKQFMFAAPTPNYYSSFFIGYSLDYNYTSLNGDTLAIASTLNGDRHPLVDYSLVYSATAIDTTLDTIYNVQNAVLQMDNRWYDNYSQNDSIRNNLAIYPVVVIGYTAGVGGVTRNNLTFYGNYPNPTTNNTNVKFSLAKNTDVTIQLMDMSGRVLNTVHEKNAGAGDHITQLNTSNLPAGEYLYLLRTEDGDGIAGKIIKQ